MTTIHREALVPYTAAQMYDLVNDVAAYPQFLPWCSRALVESASDDEMRASVEISKGGLNKTFTTLNRLQRHKMIEMRLVDGPFKHLQGFWRFDAVDDTGCRVAFDIDFEFSNTLTKLALGAVFSQITNTLVDSFCQRAVGVYGRR
jgi:ribosome-associated toxin RatA of RatAB toxin-antitoxin module